jgi:hypothetical protein
MHQHMEELLERLRESEARLDDRLAAVEANLRSGLAILEREEASSAWRLGVGLAVLGVVAVLLALGWAANYTKVKKLHES